MLDRPLEPGELVTFMEGSTVLYTRFVGRVGKVLFVKPGHDMDNNLVTVEFKNARGMVQTSQSRLVLFEGVHAKIAAYLMECTP